MRMGICGMLILGRLRDELWGITAYIYENDVKALECPEQQYDRNWDREPENLNSICDCQ